VESAWEPTLWNDPLGASVELRYLSAPADVVFDRIQHRGRENPPIERDAVSRWFEIFEPPTPEEMALFDDPLIADAGSGSGWHRGEAAAPANGSGAAELAGESDGLTWTDRLAWRGRGSLLW
jgi:hypothetical protein